MCPLVIDIDIGIEQQLGMETPRLEELQALHAIFDNDLRVHDEGLSMFLTDGEVGFIDDSPIEFDIELKLQGEDGCERG